uniref:Secreted protein n=1 Tax=Rhizophora mucronata TaxID=61149 RepID=A0A2P2KLN3_RHIMU
MIVIASSHLLAFVVPFQTVDHPSEDQEHEESKGKISLRRPGRKKSALFKCNSGGVALAPSMHRKRTFCHVCVV